MKLKGVSANPGNCINRSGSLDCPGQGRSSHQVVTAHLVIGTGGPNGVLIQAGDSDMIARRRFVVRAKSPATIKR